MKIMQILWYNASWMIYNSLLALIAVSAGWIMYLTKSKLLRLVSGIFWFFMVPNTIYILTDIGHFFREYNQFSVPLAVALIIQYAVVMLLGIVTFVFAVYPFEKLLEKYFRKKKTVILYSVFTINLCIAIGVTIGRILRLNSWEVLTDPAKFIVDLETFVHTSYLIAFAGIFFLLTCGVYYMCKPHLLEFVKPFFRKSR